MRDHAAPGAARLYMLVALAVLTRGAAALEASDSPQTLFGELFVRVQMERVFVDSKDFCDAVPNSAPADILARYRAAPPRTRDDLIAFVNANFTAPASHAPSSPALRVAPPGGAPSLRAHIDELWNFLARSPADSPPHSSLLPLPKSFVVPGGRFREIYYWDSYFTMLGLLESGRRDLTEDMVEDFAHLIDEYGHIPNGNRTYYLSRSQPPFFFEMVALLSPQNPAAGFARYLRELKREYSFWMAGGEKLRPGSAHRRLVALAPGVLLNRYWDDSDTARDESYREDTVLARSGQRPPRQFLRDVRAAAESGWDFSSRWLADAHTLRTIDTTAVVPVDLNSLLFGLERAIGSGCERAEEKDCAREYSRRAAARRAALDRYLWDATRGVYLDYDWPQRRRVPRVSAATLYPLFTGAASSAQASAVAAGVSAQLLKSGGLVTTTVNTGQQWDAPNGWAPLQWIAVAGLNAYGETQLAGQIACRWVVNVSRVYRESGKLVEKYDVLTVDRPGGGGEYPLQDGFGWTNGVTRKLLALYPAAGEYRTVERCREEPAPAPAGP